MSWLSVITSVVEIVGRLIPKRKAKRVEIEDDGVDRKGVPTFLDVERQLNAARNAGHEKDKKP